MGSDRERTVSDREEKKSANKGNIQVQQGNNSIAIIGNLSPVDLNINQTVHVHNNEAPTADGKPSKPGDVSAAKLPGKREWSNPKKLTTAKIWTKKDGTFCLSTKTDNHSDGMAEFALSNVRKSTKQMRFVMIICHHWPKGVKVSEIVRGVYPEDTNGLRDNNDKAKALLKKVRSLVSDVRKKLAHSGINPEIVSSLGMEATATDHVSLNVVHLHKVDEQAI